MQNSFISRNWPQLGAIFGNRNGRRATLHARSEPAFKSDLYSADQMEQHGVTLAGWHKLSGARTADQLLGRLASNEDVLTSTCNMLTATIKDNRPIPPAGEWLLDNFYLIEDQIHTARKHLPKGYSRELPRLLNGPSAGLPRVYDIALETMSHSDGRIELERLSRFLAAYQTVTALKIGELWAVPIMLRLALIENLRRVGARISLACADRKLAGVWADRMLEKAENDSKNLILVIADMARSNPPLVSAFVAELERKLQGRGPALALPLTWIEDRLSEGGSSIEQMVRAEVQQQASDQVSISNSIGSLRFLGSTNWKEFVESQSIIEQTLRRDPVGVYQHMDFTTRDRYRHSIERLAKRSSLSEEQLALLAINLAANRAAVCGNLDRQSHVGYYLIDKGLPLMALAAGGRHSIFRTLFAALGRRPFLIYSGSIIVLTSVLSAFLINMARAQSPSKWLVLLTGITCFLSLSQLSVALVNCLTMLLVKPHPLPRIDFVGGISPDCKTLVIVPTMLSSTGNIEDLLEALEVRYLANTVDHLHFGLLTDFPDAAAEDMPGDAPLLELLARGITDLNEKYRSEGNDLFFLFHRPRRWNEVDQIWMGYERKRGKLSDLNRLLQGKGAGGFSLVVGDTDVLVGTKYVITLDTDTKLPRDAARQMIGAMQHPLNRPRIDETKKIVVEGYGILQPRVAVSLPGTSQSAYARLYGSDPGIDPYTMAVSDVYQDLFHEGSFIGKGIYDVDAFEATLKERFPENRILSHDLLEGCYARSGLLSDVQLFEDPPSTFKADTTRRHRWIRGDWQLLAWLMPRSPLPGKDSENNPLSFLSLWKLEDNLRRSLTPPALLILLLLGWTELTPHWFWTLAVVSIFFLPPLIMSVVEVFRKSEEAQLGEHISAVSNVATIRLAQAAFALACLPYEACANLQAVAVTCWRMAVSGKNLLSWTTSASVGRGGAGIFDTYLMMIFCPLIAIITALALAVFYPSALAIAAPLLALWIFSPAVVWTLSRPSSQGVLQLSRDEVIFLRQVARKTWLFFETFVAAEDNWLPPDNYQEYPVERLAHRTSPTNIGLALLSNLGAYDFGYIVGGQVLERTRCTLDTMEGLERHRGHFYNWYDTQTLQPLLPHYVSTVDSGNLAGHLFTLRRGLLALADDKILAGQFFYGLGDSLSVLLNAITASPGAAVPAGLTALIGETQSACGSQFVTLAALHSCLDKLTLNALALATELESSAGIDVALWARKASNQCAAALNELTYLTPWVDDSSLVTWIMEASVGQPVLSLLDQIPSLKTLIGLETMVMSELTAQPEVLKTPEYDQHLERLRALLATASRRAGERVGELEALAFKAGELADMDYDFLFDRARRLLCIGYNVGERRLDASYYDLLASEARLANFVGIAQGQLPQESWFALGRLLASSGGEPILFSWSGSMFEYLMPLLVMPTYKGTLLDQTCRAAVLRQIAYGKQNGVPWGISESGYNTVDVHLNYQYRAFGVPGLGLKRGLAEDLVIAPYSSMLALMVAAPEACANLERLAADGFIGKFGFYEAVDYTPSRVPHGQQYSIIRSFMSHHQGMGFLSLAYALLGQPMQKRFESEPSFQSTTLLLQERIPKLVSFHTKTAEISGMTTTVTGPESPVRFFTGPDTTSPEVHLLSNGRYHVLVSNAGGGYSRWNDIAVTRFREDATLDNCGMFCYIRDLTSSEYWSPAFQPTVKGTETYEAIFSEARVEFRRRGFDCDVHTEIVVSPEDDIELRRVRITNRSQAHRTIDVTSYAEIVLANQMADALHPAFSKLFVQTENVEGRPAILCNRRPRSADERTPWMFHLMVAHGGIIEEISRETDRSKFIGRGRTTAHPEVMSKPGPLSGSDGSVLDPIVAIRYRLTMEPFSSVIIDMVMGMGESKEVCLGLIEKYNDRGLADRVFDLAWTHSQVVLRQINANESDAQLYSKLAGAIVYANNGLRADSGTIMKNRRGQSGLWGYAVSGDLPILLLQIEDQANLDLVRQVVQAHAYWRLKGLAVDLVIWNDDRAGYRQMLQDQIMALIAAGVEANIVDRPGGIFVRSAEHISSEDRILFQSVARAIISDRRGTLSEQLSRRVREARVPSLVVAKTSARLPVLECPWRELVLFNGLGGFTRDGREYVITTAAGQATPAPWVNVLANTQLGTVISENGLSYTWYENAHEFRLTPWYNDPVCDATGEVFYLRDEESGRFWSPTPLPVRGEDSYYISRHGFGYSVFEHTEGGIVSELWVYVAKDAPVKFAALKVRNASGRPRRLSATGYVEWVLGDLRSKSGMHVVTEIDGKTGAMFARNHFNSEFGNLVAFFDTDEQARTVTGDRTEFLGRNGSLSNPAAMAKTRLSGKVGAALDACGAMQVSFDLADGQEREIIFRMGVGRDANDASHLVQRFRGSGARRDAFESLCQYWKHSLGTVNVDTPDQSVNMLVNGWLLYQTIACRLWARSGFYQSGGAYGFRDQLQDIMALNHAEPQLMRDHLLLCASRQFVEGDVQHWWHPPAGRGVRTHCSDDFLWLPLATCRYVTSSGDTGVLDEVVQYLQGRPLRSEDESYYDMPARSEEGGTLYEHCKRAINRGLTSGVHGLPLIGSCDWNDGMNLIGKEGQGESVWLGFFLCDVLSRFAEIARMRGDDQFVSHCLENLENLKAHIESQGWDGNWYLRAYFDDGTALGSAQNEECQIDAVAQSWSVLSGAGRPDRSRQAMEAVDERLVRRDSGLIQLLDPPFDKADMNPGYIKGYVPGVRENGGQYTHAAVWTAMAFAALGDNKRAWELFCLINPVLHASSPEGVATYKVEPYVVAADVYAVPPHTGRGGWTWYTGSAGWMYRLIVESLLGLRREVDKLMFSPCLPEDWQQFKVHYRFHETVYHITVLPKASANFKTEIRLDGQDQKNEYIYLVDDRREHLVEVRLPHPPAL